ncbi:piggyBac transposable element-derived protein 3-like [Macrobrachium rosenbergii]|uniref:piggyBac transposable element-derived protein 3-like n=1 Tax=Macrobrachium rosenbergii TaxID=79674 RepID=UPI0034D5DE67
MALFMVYSCIIAHTAQLPEEEALMNTSAKVVTALLRIVKHPNFFTSIGLVEHLRDTCQRCYVGTARIDQDRKPWAYNQLPSSTARRPNEWKDNKVVNMMSIDAGVEPLASVKRYDRDAKEKVDVPCPDVIKQYSSKMGGIDKSDMLTHLYKTPLRSRR